MPIDESTDGECIVCVLQGHMTAFQSRHATSLSWIVSEMMLCRYRRARYRHYRDRNIEHQPTSILGLVVSRGDPPIQSKYFILNATQVLDISGDIFRNCFTIIYTAHRHAVVTAGDASHCQHRFRRTF